MKTKYLPLVLAALLAGCNGGSGSGNDEKPRDHFASKITGRGANALTGQAAIFDAGLDLAGFSNQKRSALPDSSNLMSASYVPPNKESKAERLKNAVQSGACNINLNKEDFENMPSESAFPVAPFKMQIAGNGCPIAVNFEVTFTGDNGNPCTTDQNTMACRFKAEVKMSYRVLNMQLAQELGVSDGSIAIVFNIDQTQSMGGSSQGPIAQSLKGDSNFSLKAVDPQGAAYLITGSNFVDMKIVMDPHSHGIPQLSGAMKEELQYFDEATNTTSKLWASINAKGQSADEKYFVDGVRVTAKAYQSERQKFANSLMTFEFISGSEENDGIDSAPDYPDYPPAPDYPGPNYPPAPQPPMPDFPEPDFPEPDYPQPDWPQPAPFPPESNFPPSPTPMPAKSLWACVITDNVTNDIFIGYGSNEFVAKSKAKQNCTATGSKYCGTYTDCDKIETDRLAWYCEAKNSVTSRIFGGEGRSQVEAAYFARKDCIKYSGKNAKYCQKVYDFNCVQQ